MLLVSLVLLASLALSFVLVTLAYLISKKSSLDREKVSPFECGFDPYKTARLPFSLRFFLIAVIFLIFDVEITLLLPIPLILSSIPTFTLMLTSLTFVSVLLMGLYYEWYNGALEWA